MPRRLVTALLSASLLLCCGDKAGSDDDDDDHAHHDSADSGRDSGGGSDDTAAPVDAAGPLIEHVPVSTPQPLGSDVVVEARVTDAGSGVDRVWIQHRPQDEAGWTSASMTADEVDGGLYVGRIPAAALSGAGVAYHLVAEDVAGNTSFAPADGAANPIWFGVSGE